MSKSRRYNRSANDSRFVGYREFEKEQEEVMMVTMSRKPQPPKEPEKEEIRHRARKARRAQARLDGKNWRELTQKQKMQL